MRLNQGYAADIGLQEMVQSNQGPYVNYSYGPLFSQPQVYCTETFEKIIYHLRLVIETATSKPHDIQGQYLTPRPVLNAPLKAS